jgi:hypothetical protein
LTGKPKSIAIEKCQLFLGQRYVITIEWIALRLVQWYDFCRPKSIKTKVMDENFPRKPGLPCLSSDCRVFQSGCSPFQFIKNIFLVKITPQFVLSTLKCKMTPKALILHLQSIKLQKSFYSSNFFNFTCAVMSWFAKFQVFFASTILIPGYSSL